MVKDFFVFLDVGYGGFDVDGKYVMVFSKEFKYSCGIFYKDGWFYEGVFNWIVMNLVVWKLWDLLIFYYMVSYEYEDISLYYWVDLVNWYVKKVWKLLYILNYVNAGGGSVCGFEIYISLGCMNFDKVVELYWNNVKDLLGDWISWYCSDISDGDYDKEVCFFVLICISMFVILVEYFFFDNYEDVSLLMDDEIVECFVEV